MADLKKLDDMSTEERIAFLETLAESLLMSASIAKHEDDPLWRIWLNSAIAFKWTPRLLRQTTRREPSLWFEMLSIFLRGSSMAEEGAILFTDHKRCLPQRRAPLFSFVERKSPRRVIRAAFIIRDLR